MEGWQIRKKRVDKKAILLIIICLGLFCLFYSMEMITFLELVILSVFYIFIGFLFERKAVKIIKYDRENDTLVKKFTIKRLIKEGYVGYQNTNIFYRESDIKYIEYIEELLRVEENYKEFERHGFIYIVLNHKELEQLKYHIKSKNKNYVTGVFFKKQKCLCLLTDLYSVKDKDFVEIPYEIFKATFYHEMGHFWDYYNGIISETDVVKKSYNKRKEEIKAQLDKSLIKENKVKKELLENYYELTTNEEYYAENYSRFKCNKNYDLSLQGIFKED